MADRTLPPEAWLCALLELPGMGPSRLHRLLATRTPEQAWVAVGRAGVRLARTPEATVDEWRRTAATVDVASVWARYVGAGVGVTAVGSPALPECLVTDPEPPGVIFHVGDPTVLAAPRVALVGTRRCTRYGAELAFELGEALAAAGVVVVSGLAVGIDGFAHRGALAARAAPPVAVVGSGLDVVYPRANHGLWHDVAAAGAVLSEAPLGAPPEPWRFPARNRIIASLADVVVVVESRETGGSLHTAAEALARDRPLMAVPGPVRSPASRGTNRLLVDGCAPACEPDDVLLALGLVPGGQRAPVAPPAIEGADEVLDACSWQPVTLAQLVERSARPVAEVSVTVERLLACGHLAARGPWLERVTEPAGRR